MPRRDYDVEAENILPDGFWPGEPIEIDELPGMIEQLMADAAGVLRFVGGTFSIVAVRREIAPGLFVPWKYRAKWESFAPAQRQEPKAEPITEEEIEALEEQGDDPDPSQNSTDPDIEEVEDDFGPDAEQALAAAER